jgi:hypothetical protein
MVMMKERRKAAHREVHFVGLPKLAMQDRKERLRISRSENDTITHPLPSPFSAALGKSGRGRIVRYQAAEMLTRKVASQSEWGWDRRAASYS